MNLSSKKELEYEVILKSLIGKKIKIVDSKIKSQIGLEGTVIYESANLLFLDVKGYTLKILKKNIVFQTRLNGKALNIDGRLLFSTVLSRIKKIK